ncbi:MAG: hypothetical protein ACKPKO_00375, partial [Candidatus Fonsibacter sp.]
MPDLRLGLLDAGEGITQEGIDMWNELSFSFFSSTAAKNDAKAKRAKAKAKSKPASKAQVRAATRGSTTRVPRKSSFRFLRTIDYLWVTTLGFGLASFCKASQAPLLQRPLLLLHTNERTIGMAAVWFLN